LILVGFAAALRPSELAALKIARLTRHDDRVAASRHQKKLRARYLFGTSTD
jgi:hypothetical protein